MYKTAKTINIYLIAEMKRCGPEHSYDYMVYIEGKKIEIIPTNTQAQFTDVYLSPEFVTANNEEELIKIFGINLTANIELNGTENDDYHVIVDELGQIVITLDVNLEDTDSYGEFVEVVENKDVDLITEAEEPSKDTEDAPAETEEEETEISSVTAEVLNEAEEEIPEEQWIVTYDVDNLQEDIEAEEGNNAVVCAPDIQTAVKYAEQNARIKAKENPAWSDAEVISIKKKTT